jgi:hypothetical protein
MITCPACSGEGGYPAGDSPSDGMRCTLCAGTGRAPAGARVEKGFFTNKYWVDCQRCGAANRAFDFKGPKLAPDVITDPEYRRKQCSRCGSSFGW